MISSFVLSCALLTCICSVATTHGQKYEPTWDSLDKRPLPQWYDEAKVGIFIHWGVFSVPSFGNAWFWYNWETKNPSIVKFMEENYRPGFTYPDFARMFKAEFYNPDQWADILARSGARYVVLVSKHHEGFTNWGSKYSWNWNAVDNGPNRDLVGDLAKSIRNRTNMHFGLYHSLFDFFHPLWLQDKANNFTTQDFVRSKSFPSLLEIVNAYKPEVIWSDGDWEATPTYWNATEFIAWLYNYSPVKDTVVINDRWGIGARCKHGGYFTCTDHYNPGTLQPHKWENCMTIDRGSWGYRRNANIQDYLTINDLVTELAETVSCGGNILINIGPTHDGRIMPVFEERLKQLGDWLKVNGEAIYGSKPWTHQNDTFTPGVWYTSQKAPSRTDVYAIVLKWPMDGRLYLGAPFANTATVVEMLGLPGAIRWERGLTGGMTVLFPQLSLSQLPSTVAWVLKLSNLSVAREEFRAFGFEAFRDRF